MKRYVVGFLFDKKGNVALIHKLRPKWQRHRFNGIGGHIEPGETPHAAMVREFKEETGAMVRQWHEFVVVKGSDYRLHCFSAHKGGVKLKSVTDEQPLWYPLAFAYPMLANLEWLIPMANYKFKLRGEVWHDDPEC